MLRRIILCLALLFAAQSAVAEEPSEHVIAALSQNAVGITADFSGSEIFVFGAIGRNFTLDSSLPRPEIIIAVTGPADAAFVRKKERVFGIWVNTETVRVDKAPGFYAISTTGPLNEILSETDDLRYRISVDQVVRVVGEAANVDEPAEFREAVIRLNRASGVYYEQIGGVKMTEKTLFQAHFDLPSNLVEGDYRARVFLVRGKVVLDSYETAITVRKVGLERWIYNLANEQSLIYGLLSILLALSAGWGASEAFRLMRR